MSAAADLEVKLPCMYELGIALCLQCFSRHKGKYYHYAFLNLDGNYYWHDELRGRVYRRIDGRFSR